MSCHETDALLKIIEEQKITISQISHELRNPVTLVSSYLQLVEKQHPEAHDFAFWTDTKRELKYLLRLLDEVSNYNNGAALHLETLNTSQWLTEVAASLKTTTYEPFRFTYNIPDALPPLPADAVKLQQAVTNLVRNGFEALPSQGEVSLTASADDSFLLLRISDTGCGIPKEYMDTLYQPFVTHKPNGTGLGLTITKRIIEAHRGELFLESSPGVGTSFTIRLPLECAPCF